MPSTGFYSFLRFRNTTPENILHVSMPSTGFYSFLQEPNMSLENFKRSVNALNGLLLISTNYSRKINKRPGILCQCPQRASTHFYSVLNGLQILAATNVSMPSTGFYSFLQYSFLVRNFMDMCQCPQRASTHFYYVRNDQRSNNPRCVNALNGLLLISTVSMMHVTNIGVNGVNALNGLLLISTEIQDVLASA